MRDLATEKNEKSLGEILVIVTMVAILMSVFLYYFFKQEQNYTATGLQSLKNSFASKVRVIHAQWIIDGHPNTVKLKFQHDDKHTLVAVNDLGWVDVPASSLYCENIWAQVMDMPLMLMKSPITAIEVRKQGKHVQKVCRFGVSQHDYFEYNSQNGQVQLVEKQ
ncbi:hypothetical protein [Thalassotalea sp. PLHSN55]|uniref:hypothetical protein n=1 Tax=Thalassotalea sp. PLHSN55 TaxID=3435888 RepID=UPI003F8394E9